MKWSNTDCPSCLDEETSHDMALHLAPFSRWTLRDKPSQRPLALRETGPMEPRPCANPDAIPSWVPAEIRAEIDLSELSGMDPKALQERDSLCVELDLNVAAYPSTARGMPHGLCSVFRAARLSGPQIQRLQSSESTFPGTAFVAYCKPLQRHHPIQIQHS